MLQSKSTPLASCLFTLATSTPLDPATFEFGVVIGQRPGPTTSLMHYTALQTLGWLATHSTWERAYNVNRAFLRHTSGYHAQKCSIIVGRKKTQRRLGQHKSKKGKQLVVVFKTAIPIHASAITKAKKAAVGRMGRSAEVEAVDVAEGHLGCGMLDCRVCGVFLELFCEDVEEIAA